MEKSRMKDRLPIIVVLAITVALVATLFVVTDTFAANKKQQFGDYANITLELDATLEQFDADFEVEGVDRQFIINSTSDTLNRLLNIKFHLMDNITPHACFEDSFWSTIWYIDRQIILEGWFLTFLTQDQGAQAHEDTQEFLFDALGYAADEYIEDFNAALDECGLPNNFAIDPTNVGWSEVTIDASQFKASA
jgi:hypothetical protein